MNKIELKISNKKNYLELYEQDLYDKVTQFSQKTKLNNREDHIAAKNVRAEANKYLDALETQKKALKKMINKEIDEQANNYLKSFNTNTQELKSLITEYEEDYKKARYIEILGVFANLPEKQNNQIQWLEFDQIFDDKWLSISKKLSDVESEIKRIIDQIKEDITYLVTDEELEEYKKNLDLSSILKNRAQENKAGNAININVTVDNQQDYKKLINFLESEGITYDNIV